ncbi:MAG TPA: glucose 1-dehydrogenase [Anaerolineales bacterium]
MKAIAVVSGTPELKLVERPEPSISAPDEIKLRILRVGICGTDREEAAGGRSKPPDGAQELVIGHEMFGQVVEAGQAVTRVKPGDYAVFTVRRGCGKCLPCLMNRSDMCETGQYTERGIWGRDGYQTELVVDREQYIVAVPPELETAAVLTEPLTIAEKAILEATRIQYGRLPGTLSTPDWLSGRPCLVAGLGPVGLLAALALRLRGAEVYGLDIVDPASARPKWLETIGGRYIDGRQVPPDQVDAAVGEIDMIFEAAGVPKLEFNLLDALSVNGIYVLTGIPGGDNPIQIDGAELVRRLVLNNQVMFGSVNASRGHFQMAVDDLERGHQRWGEHIDRLITNRHPYTDFETALKQHPDDEIKAVIEWSDGKK